jgi:hypothetical protein
MLIRSIDRFFLEKEEPDKSCLLALRTFIPTLSTEITEEWKYALPFYYFRGKMFCYLWTHKKFKQPYIGIVKGGQIDHPLLLAENRSKMKILLIDPNTDLPVDEIREILGMAMELY